jgi:hypothetical protein
MNINIIRYEYKTGILNLDSHSNTYLIYNIELYRVSLSIYYWFYN